MRGAAGKQRGLQGPPPSLAEQLKQVLAERERRISGGDNSSREGSGDFTDINKGISQSLVEEIRQAVNEANLRGNFGASKRGSELNLGNEQSI